MIKILITFIILLVTLPANAETLWVRHNHSGGADNGQSYADAWEGFGNVVWGTSAGEVGPSDTLYVCGATWDETLIVGASGTSGSEIIIRGDCSSVDGGYTDGIIGRVSLTNASVSVGQSISLYGDSYIIIQNLTFDDPFGVREKDKQSISSGQHTAAGSSSTVLTDSTKSWTVDSLIGGMIFNTSDGTSRGIITDNDATTVTVASMTNGNFDQNDYYQISRDYSSIQLGGVTHHITIKDSTFLLNDGDIGYGIHFYATSGADIHDITIDSNTATGGDESFIFAWQKGDGSNDSAGIYYNITVKDNTSTGGYSFFYDRNFAAYRDEMDSDGDGDNDNDRFVYNVDIDNNVIGIKDGGFKAIGFSGLHEVPGDGKNYIRNNTITNVGTQVPYTNTVQLSFVKDLIVENNTITGPHLTSNCDGGAIIVDYMWTDTDYISHDVIVRNNTIINADSDGCEGKGVSVFRGTNVQVYNNVITGTDIGIRVASTDDAGNTSTDVKLWNNTIYNSGIDGIRVSADTPTVEIKNNLISVSGRYGILDSSDNVADAGEDFNLVYDSTTGDCIGAFGARTDNTCNVAGDDVLSQDPLLKADYSINPNSPAKDAGTIIADMQAEDIDGTVRPQGTDWDIGAFEYTGGSISGVTIGMIND